MHDLKNNIEEQILSYKEYGNMLTSFNIDDLYKLFLIKEMIEKQELSDDITTDIDDYIRNLNNCFKDLLETRENHSNVKDQTSKTKLLTDMRAFSDCFYTIYKGIWESCVIAEERNYLTQMLPKLQQLK